MELKMKHLLFLIMALAFVINYNIYSQNYNYTCPEVQINIEAVEAQTGGIYKLSSNAPGKYLRVFFVFVQFSGDNRVFPDWTYGQLPAYANQLVDSVTSSQYRSFTVSDYWKTMSMGTYDIIGDIYPDVITLRSENWYMANNKYFQDANIDVLDSINGNVDFRKYDNWGFNSSTNSFVFNPRNGDGYLDMMYIIYRTPQNDSSWFTRGYGTFGGIAILGNNFTYTTRDSVIIDGNYLWHKASGITIRAGAGMSFPSIINCLSHELGHYLFGSGHPKMSGLMSYNSNTLTLSSWERERLGYIACTTPYQDNFTITLQDYVTTGQVLKMPIPNSSDKYFLVENHQRLSKYDQIMQGGQLQGAFDTITTLGKGIYVWLIKNGNSYPPSIDIKTANGNWNWIYDGDYYAGPGWYVGQPWEGYVPKTKRGSVNRDGFGKSDRYPDHIWWNNHWAAKWADTNPLTKQYELSRNVLGLETHPFNYNYTRLFTPWSSPSTYVDGETNLSMQVFSESGNNITLKVFNTSNSGLSLPPSKTQNLRVSIENFYARLDWEANLEPDMYRLGKYKIYRSTTSGGAPTSFNYLTSIAAFSGKIPVTSWVDYNSYCSGTGYKVFYYITAVDNSLLESEPSDWDWAPYNPAYWKQDQNSQTEVTHFQLHSNYPNPFNPLTRISYSVAEQSHILMKVYNSLGQEVVVLVDEVKEKGNYSVEFQGKELPSGIYICNMIAYNNSKMLHIFNNEMMMLK